MPALAGILVPNASTAFYEIAIRNTVGAIVSNPHSNQAGTTACWLASLNPLNDGLKIQFDTRL